MGEMGKSEETLQEVKPKVIIMDLGKVLLFSTEKDHVGKLNPRHKQLKEELGDDYDFFSYFGLNVELLELLSELKEHYPIHMITEGKIQEDPKLKKELNRVFDYTNIHSTGKLGLKKTDPDAYTQILEGLELKPGDVLFVDDSEKNIDAAKSAGLQTLYYKSEEQVIKTLRERLELP